MSSILKNSRMQIGSLQQSWNLQMSSFAAPFPSFPPHLQYRETSSRLTLCLLVFKHSLFGVFLNSSGDSFKVSSEDDVEPFPAIKYEVRVIQGCAKSQIDSANNDYWKAAMHQKKPVIGLSLSLRCIFLSRSFSCPCCLVTPNTPVSSRTGEPW